jgi:NCS2 family nucleobase:cation symporter-2
VFLMLPRPVVGAAVTFTAMFMFVGGLQVILSRNLDLRGTFVVGLSTLAAVARGVYPAYFMTAPDLIRSMGGSMLSLAAVAALALNSVFRLGATRRASIRLGATPGSLDELERQLRADAEAWGVDGELTDRAVEATRGLIGHLEEARLVQGEVEAKVALDAAELAITLAYAGAPLILPYTSVRHRLLIEEQAFSYSLADLLSGVHPDRMTGRAEGERVAITLSFDR